MKITLKQKLEKNPVTMSAPCRLDFGGTLDISTFYFPLRPLAPSTFNVAVDMRTTVSLLPYTSGRVKISSRGFETAEYDSGNLPLAHPMGLMFAIATYFGADGVHIDVRSSSPPRSALGGSSVAAVALIAAFFSLTGKVNDGRMPEDEVVLLAHQLESSVARVPCGIQDQLAAAFGGVNRWRWTGDVSGLPYERTILIEKAEYDQFESSFIAAYCGQPHESKDINGRWVNYFLNGTYPELWKEIVVCSNLFSLAIAEKDYIKAAALMQRETALRVQMTPDVLDETGILLNKAAISNDCGARFTGAGGGGCVWATGPASKISQLRSVWEALLSDNEYAFMLDVRIDGEGLRHESE